MTLISDSDNIQLIYTILNTWFSIFLKKKSYAYFCLKSREIRMISIVDLCDSLL